ncbi:MAG: CHRD domain-containing protein [Methylomonas sp.]
MKMHSSKYLTYASLASLLSMPAIAADDISAQLDGYHVVSSQSTAGTAQFNATIDRAKKMIEYTLSYKDLEGDILQSHIHFGLPGTNGGIVSFLCTNLTPSNDPSRPRNQAIACPGTREGTVTGTILPNNVVYVPFGLPGVGGNPGVGQFPFDKTAGTTSQQLIEPGEFDELVKAIDAGATYIVVHTKAQPTGELRGNVGAAQPQGSSDLGSNNATGTPNLTNMTGVTHP